MRWPTGAEQRMLDAIAARRRTGSAVDLVAKRLTRAGEHGLIWHAIAFPMAVIDTRRQKQWLFVSAANGIGYGINTAIKLIVRRPRPAGGTVKTISQLSFPSAHATTSFAAARVLSGLVPAPAAYWLAVKIAATRIYFGVHYPSDVIAGALLGTAVGSVVKRKAV